MSENTPETSENKLETSENKPAMSENKPDFEREWNGREKTKIK